MDGDGVSVQEALNLLVSWVGFSALAPEGTALGLSSPLPCVGKTPPLLPLGVSLQLSGQTSTDGKC